jgi:hypothetical protein
MPQSIPKGLTRDAVLKALADLDAGIERRFPRKEKRLTFLLVAAAFPEGLSW